MIRSTIALLALAAGTLATSQADDKSDSLRRARVALALADSHPVRTDLDAARADSLHTGKPLVLFIRDAAGAKLPRTSAAIYCRVPSYKLDGKDAQGIVVLGPMAGSDMRSLYVWEQLPGDAPAVKVGQAVSAARSKAPSPMDWFN